MNNLLHHPMQPAELSLPVQSSTCDDPVDPCWSGCHSSTVDRLHCGTREILVMSSPAGSFPLGALSPLLRTEDLECSQCKRSLKLPSLETSVKDKEYSKPMFTTWAKRVVEWYVSKLSAPSLPGSHLPYSLSLYICARFLSLSLSFYLSPLALHVHAVYTGICNQLALVLALRMFRLGLCSFWLFDAHLNETGGIASGSNGVGQVVHIQTNSIAYKYLYPAYEFACWIMTCTYMYLYVNIYYTFNHNHKAYNYNWLQYSNYDQPIP